jgi:hypothetical protein
MQQRKSQRSEASRTRSKANYSQSSKGRSKGSLPSKAEKLSHSKLDKLLHALTLQPQGRRKPPSGKKKKNRSSAMNSGDSMTWRPFGRFEGHAQQQPFEHRVEHITSQATVTFATEALSRLALIFTPSHATGTLMLCSQYSPSPYTFQLEGNYVDKSVSVLNESAPEPLNTYLDSTFIAGVLREAEPSPSLLLGSTGRVLRGAMRIKIVMSSDVNVTLCWVTLSDDDIGLGVHALYDRYVTSTLRTRKQLLPGQWYTVHGVLKDENKQKLFSAVETNHGIATNTFYTQFFWIENASGPSNGFAANPIVYLETKHEVDSRLDASLTHLATHKKQDNKPSEEPPAQTSGKNARR